MRLLWTLAFCLFGSVGAVGAATLLLVVPKRVRQALVPLLVSYATGSLLAAALLGLLPHAMEHAAPTSVLQTVLVGLMGFFVLERLVLWRHCHVEGACEVHGAAGPLILIGDALHNFVDGVAVAAAFLTSIPLGMATGVAVIAHELPQEIGDFAILLDSRFGPGRALLWNLISGIAMFPGAVLGYVALERAGTALPYVLGLSAASFLYIGLADLIPGLHRRLEAGAGVTHLLLMLSGIGTIVLLGFLHD